MWLGEDKGELTDWLTQRWVQLTGRRIELTDHPWLSGPIGSPSGIGRLYYEQLAESEQLQLRIGPAGLMHRFSDLSGPPPAPPAGGPGRR